ncbi:MAG: hypothetical protein ACYSSP_01405 [Planctomycetota bacterium]|jgi:hypothetical protein
MFDFALSFEQAAMRFSAPVLVVPGLILVFAGLFIWLGGLGFSRIFIATVGAVAGCLCGLFIIGKNIAAAVILAVIVATLAMVWKRIFITILLAIVGAVAAFFIFTSDYFDESGYRHPLAMSASGEKADIGRSLQAITDFSAEFTSTMRMASLKMPAYHWAFIAGAFILGLVICFVVWRVGSALCCAAMGSICIFAGMVLLLIFKGSYPITVIGAKPTFYLAVFGGMTAFGTIEQMVLYRPKSKPKGPKNEPKKKKKRRIEEEHEEPKKRFTDWRTS